MGTTRKAPYEDLLKKREKYLVKMVLLIFVFHSFNWSFVFILSELDLVLYFLVKFPFVLVSNLIRKMSHILIRK